MSVKSRISITINRNLDQMLGRMTKKIGISKSLLIEKAVEDYFQKTMEDDVKKLAKMKFKDLPTEDEWLEIQN